MTGEAKLCNWTDYEAYTLIQAPKKAPTPHCWALRAQERPSVKRPNDEEHAYIFCVERPEEVKRWVFAVWSARVRWGHSGGSDRLCPPSTLTSPAARGERRAAHHHRTARSWRRTPRCSASSSSAAAGYVAGGWVPSPWEIMTAG